MLGQARASNALLHWTITFRFPLHSPGGRSYSNAHFGAGTGPIFLDDVQCTSSSSQLLECYSRPILSHNCRHVYDAGVGCEGSLIKQAAGAGNMPLCITILVSF